MSEGVEKKYVQEVTDDTFEELVLNAKGSVAVDFCAPWCGPCRAMAPVLEIVAQSLVEKGIGVKVYKMNVEDNLETPTKYGVRSLPTIITFFDGVPMANVNGGGHSAEFLVNALKVYEPEEKSDGTDIA